MTKPAILHQSAPKPANKANSRRSIQVVGVSRRADVATDWIRFVSPGVTPVHVAKCCRMLHPVSRLKRNRSLHMRPRTRPWIGKRISLQSRLGIDGPQPSPADTRIHIIASFSCPFMDQEWSRSSAREREPLLPRMPAPRATSVIVGVGCPCNFAANSGSARACRARRRGCRGIRPARWRAWSASRRACRGAGARRARRGAWAGCRPCSRSSRSW